MAITPADAGSARRLFLSYRREDTGNEAARLSEALLQVFGAGNVFWDRDSIEGGEVWPDRLRLEAPNCQACLVLIGKQWIDVRAKSVEMTPFIISRETHGERLVPAWLEVITNKMRVLVHSLPVRAQIDVPVQEQLIVEYYSKK